MASTFLPRFARPRCIRLFLACSLAPLPVLLPGTTQALESSGTIVQWGMPIVTTPQVSDVTRVAIGELHVLALKQDGELLGWGSNANGELQVQAGTFGTHLTQIAAGNNRSAGLWSDGRVTGSGFLGGFTYSSWTDVTAISMRGMQTIGRRSDGTVLATGGTAPPAGLTDVAAVAAGAEHALALLADGSVVAWGNNNYGQCSVPVGLTGVTAIAAGGYHSLALLADGSVVAWGAGAQNSGQWPDHGQSMVPPGLQGVTAIAAGALHSVALKSDGSVVCWGNNDSGQCDVPPGLGNAFRIAAGTHATAAILQPTPEITVVTGNLSLLDGSRVTIGPVVPGGSMVRTFTIYNQGTAPLNGIQVVVDGVDGSRFALTPPATTSLAPQGYTTFSVNFQPVAAGAFFARVRILSNDSDEGEFDIPLLGTTPMGAVTWGGRRDRLLDRIPEPIADAIGVATSAFCSAVLRADGRVLLWGGDWENGTWVTYLLNGSSTTPVTGIRQIDLAEESYGVLLTNDGAVYEFDTRGWLGSSPGLPPDYVFTRVAAGYQHFLAQRPNGSLFAWGDNTYEQTEVPAGQTGLLDFAAGAYHSTAVTAGGKVIAWGHNTNGQCDVPPGLVGAVAVAAGSGHTLALKNDGTVVAWGANDYGQCNVPPGLSGVVSVSARSSSSAAIRADGSVVLWGSHRGQAPPGLPRVADYRCDAIALVAPVGELRIEHLGTELRDGMGFDFGWTPPGVPLAKTFTIRNRGGASAPLTLVKSGAEAARYTVSGIPASLAPGASANFTVTLLPTAVGPQHAVLSIFGNDPFRNPLAFALAARTPMSVSAWGLGATPPPPDLVDAIALAAGESHALALRANGTVAAWGDSEYGKTTVPAGLQNVVAVAAGASHSLALRQDGTVVQWGHTPQPPPAGLGNVKAIAAGRAHSVALRENGTVAAWGIDTNGEISGTSGFAGVTAVGAGAYFTLELSKLGDYGPTPGASGRNNYGQAYPPFFDDGLAVAGGEEHALALMQDGTVTAWGRSQVGQATVPPGLTGVRAIAAGGSHSLALRNDGTMVSWGSNFVALPPGMGPVGGIAAGSSFSLALTPPRPFLLIKKGGVTLPSYQSSLSFAGPLGVGSDPMTLTLSNAGAAPLTGLSASLPPGSAADFSLTQPAATSLAPGQSTNMTIRYLAADPNFKDIEMQIASNDPARNPFPLRLTAEPDSNIARAWKYTWFGSSGSGAPFGMAYDFDNDSTKNLLEFAFGTIPNDCASGPGQLVYSGPATGGGTLVAAGQPVILRPTSGSGPWRILWIRRKDHIAAGLSYTPEFSTDLRAWTASVVTPQVLASDFLHEVVAVDLPALLPGEISRFSRLRVFLAAAE